MTLSGLLVFLCIGLVAGWLAGLIWKGKGFGLLWNCIIGVLGSYIGGFVFRLLGIYFHGILGAIIAALAGALILLAVAHQLKKR